MPYASVHCPQCGLKSNLNASSVGTMRKCQNCGHKFIIMAPPPAPAGSSLGGCVIGLVALLGVGAVVVAGCCGLGMIGSSGSMAPVAKPTAPPSTKRADARNEAFDRIPVAETTPMPTEVPGPDPKPAGPLSTDAKPTEPMPETPAGASAFDATTIAFAPAETAERTRTFKSTDGKFSVEAVLLAMRDEVAHLRRVDNGNVIEVPMAKLANSDRIWIRKFAHTDVMKGRHDKTEAKSNAPSEVAYHIIEEWKINNGGYSRVIVVAPTHRNERDMRTLGDKLRADTAKDRHAFVFIFDDEKAARMRKDAIDEKLSEKDLAYFDKHSIGTYNRNINTGNHSLDIHVDGLDGNVIQVNY